MSEFLERGQQLSKNKEEEEKAEKREQHFPF